MPYADIYEVRLYVSESCPAHRSGRFTVMRNRYCPECFSPRTSLHVAHNDRANFLQASGLFAEADIHLAFCRGIELATLRSNQGAA